MSQTQPSRRAAFMLAADKFKSSAGASLRRLERQPRQASEPKPPRRRKSPLQMSFNRPCRVSERIANVLEYIKDGANYLGQHGYNVRVNITKDGANVLTVPAQASEQGPAEPIPYSPAAIAAAINEMAGTFSGDLDGTFENPNGAYVEAHPSGVDSSSRSVAQAATSPANQPEAWKESIESGEFNEELAKFFETANEIPAPAANVLDFEQLAFDPELAIFFDRASE